MTKYPKKEDLYIDPAQWDDNYKILSEIKTSLYLNKSCEEFVYLTARLKAQERKIDSAEIGVGYGASAIEVSRQLDENDSYSCFDFSERTDPLVEDLRRAGVTC